MAHSAIWGHLVKCKDKKPNKKSEQFKVQKFFETGVRKYSKFGSTVYEMKGFIFVSILQICLDDVVSGKAIFAHLTNTKA